MLSRTWLKKSQAIRQKQCTVQILQQFTLYRVSIVENITTGKMEEVASSEKTHYILKKESLTFIFRRRTVSKE